MLHAIFSFGFFRLAGRPFQPRSPEGTFGRPAATAVCFSLQGALCFRQLRSYQLSKIRRKKVGAPRSRPPPASCKNARAPMLSASDPRHPRARARAHTEFVAVVVVFQSPTVGSLAHCGQCCLWISAMYIPQLKNVHGSGMDIQCGSLQNVPEILGLGLVQPVETAVVADACRSWLKTSTL